MEKNIFDITLDVYNEKGVPVDELYKAFKSRLIDELAVESQELSNPAELYDATPNDIKQ